jgi:hypothetical protein
MREIVVGSRGQYTALVDDCDYDYLIQFLWTFKISDAKHYSKPYAKRTKWKGVVIYMHHEILKRMEDDGLIEPRQENETADHKNKQTLDNTRDNLRWISPKEQRKNQVRQTRPCPPKPIIPLPF